MASRKFSIGSTMIASLARSATTSSVSNARIERISARSAPGRWAPVAQTAIFLSRVARPWRRSSTTSGLRISTAGPQIFLAKHDCTGRAGSPEGRHGLPVQFQQYPRSFCGAYFELCGGGKMARGAGGNRVVKQGLAVGNDADVCGKRGRQGKIEGWRGGA